MNPSHLAALRYYANVTVLGETPPENIDASRKALLRARIINGNLEVTETGRDVLTLEDRGAVVLDSGVPEHMKTLAFTLQPVGTSKIRYRVWIHHAYGHGETQTTWSHGIHCEDFKFPNVRTARAQALRTFGPIPERKMAANPLAA